MDSAKPETLSDSSENKTEAFAERFEILGEIGCGGMSVVYRAREILLDRVVALKVLNHSALRESKVMQRFRNEAKACSALQHPNIVQTLSFGIANGKQPYLVMELLDGKTLEQVLRERGGLVKEQFQEVFLQVMDALIYAHQKNMVHRDLKPSNIMLIGEGDGNTLVKVVDFGIAKVVEDGQEKVDTQATVGLLGSPLYMSPEQCSGGKVDQRSDVYSLACVMYESIVGKPPFSGETLYETMYEHLTKSIPRFAEISGSLNIPKSLFDAIIEALAKSPDKRPASMEIFRDKVSAALSKQDKIQRPAKLAARLQSLAYLVCALALLVVIPVSFFWQRSKHPQEEWQEKSQRYIGHPDDPLLLIQSRTLRDSGNYDESLKKCQEALQRASHSAQENRSRGLCNVYSEFARTYGAMQNVDKAIEYYNKAIDIFPLPTAAARLTVVRELAQYYIGLGRVEQGNKVFANSISAAEKCLRNGETDPTIADANMQFADILYKQNKYAEALIYSKKALDYYDGLAEARCTSGGVLCSSIFVRASQALGDNNAIAEYKKTSEQLSRDLRPDPEVDIQQARILEEAGLIDEARSMLQLAEKHMSQAKPMQRKKAAEAVQEGFKRLDLSNSKQRSTGSPSEN